MEMQMKNSSSSRPLKQPSKRVLVKIIPGPNESALITGGALATLGHIDKAAALRARYMAYKRVDRRLQASQIDTDRRTRMTTSITKNNERSFRKSQKLTHFNLSGFSAVTTAYTARCAESFGP